MEEEHRDLAAAVTDEIRPLEGGKRLRDAGASDAELLELLRLEKTELKKLDTASKLDIVADKALNFSANYPEITYEEGLKLMGPVRNPNENRPV